MDRLARFIKNNYVVLAIITVGFFLRSLGLQFGKPFRYHPDEMKLVFQAARLINFQEWSLQTLDGIGFYPPLFTYILAGAYALYALVLLFLGNIPDLPAFAELYKADPFQFHYIARLVSLFSGTITVALVYAVGKRLYTKRSGQIAAGFLAVVFLHVRNSHFGVVDILLTFWVLLAFWASVRILQEGRVKYYLLAGVFAGFAVSTKYNSGLIISVIVLAHFLRTEGGVRGLLRNTIDKKIWIAGAATIVAFLLTCPFPIIDLRTFYAYSAGTVAFESRGKIGSGGDFWSYFTGGTSPGFGFFYDNNFIAALGIADAHVYGRKTFDLKANWKVVLEPFLEGYHVQRLHAASIGDNFQDAPNIVDMFGPNIRQVSGRIGYVPEMLDEDAEANVHKLVTHAYTAFPNCVQRWRTTEFEERDADSLLEVLFEAEEKGTKVTIRHSELPEHGMQYEQGWRDSYFTPMKEYFGMK